MRFCYYLFYVLAILSCIGGISSFLTGMHRLSMSALAINVIFDLAFTGICWLVSRWFKKKLEAKRLEDE